MHLATWNVNSINARLDHVLDWLRANPVDILALQELKCSDDAFPEAALADMGYGAVWAGQKTYNGVALLHNLSKQPTPADVQVNLPSFEDEQKRVIAASYGNLRVVSCYVVNGATMDSDKFQYKLLWLDALIHDCTTWLKQYPSLVMMGDFNIAPSDADVHDPSAWHEQVLCSTPERTRWQALLDLGFCDAFRLFEHPAKTFSWWDYRMLGFQKNKGLRIDHVLLSSPLNSKCSAAHIDRIPRKWMKPSDHAPVVVQLLV